jgi:uncharacterized protein YpuA (DUF1002 family)
MKANELADFILDTVDRIKESHPNEREHIVEGAVYRLTLQYDNEWEIYKIYCSWLGKNRHEGQSLIDFYKLYDKIKEAKDDYTEYKRRSKLDRTIN